MPNLNQNSNMVLHPSQKNAICHLSGPMLVLAGPGSGKTYVITNRIKNLIENHKVSPNQILVVTFTKAAAVQMKNRTLSICKEAQKTVFGTFHSIFYHILKSTQEFQNITPLLQNEKEKIIIELMQVFAKKTDIISYVNEFIMLQTYMKNNGLSWDQFDLLVDLFHRQYQIELTMEKKHLYQKVDIYYQKECKLNGKIDFDDMLFICRQKLLSDPKLLQRWKSQFQYIMVDEFQDTNEIQYELLKLLAMDHRNLFVVGDDDQSIYQFRGGDYRYMKAVETDFKPCKICYLNVNFRSCRDIVMVSKKLIERNKDRYEKDIMAHSFDPGVVLLQSYESNEQEMNLLQQILKEKEGENICVLCRTNKECEQYQKRIFASNKTVICNQINNEIVFDVIAMIKMVLGGRRRRDFFRFMNKPNRNIARCILEEEISFARLKEIYETQLSKREEINRIEDTLNMVGALDTLGGILVLFNQLQYERYVLEESEIDKRQAEITLIKIKEAAAKSRNWESLIRLLEEITVSKERKLPILNGVSCMTYHAAKGLEFDTVILPGIREGIVPHGKRYTDAELEEERRMFYVAMTRAKKNLYITYYKDAQAKQASSVFIRDILTLQ